jgi:hypothetical protein
VPAEEVVNHTCQHGYTSQNVLAICDFDMRFTFLVAGWPDSAHDTRVLNHTLTNFGDEFPIPLAGKYYPLDSGYLNRTKYLAPFKGSIFHIPEFHLRRHRVSLCAHLGSSNKKWRILKSMPSFSPRRHKHIIIVCMTLHNFIHDIPLRDEDFDKCDEDEDYMP